MEKKFIVTINIVTLLILGTSLLLFKFCGKPFIQGFYCDDTSIAKPYQKSSVPMLYVYFGSVVTAFACFTLGIGTQRGKIKADNGCSVQKNDYRSLSFEVAILFIFMVYGLGLTSFITYVGKYSVGRLRPHYLTVCSPDWSRMNCTKAYGRKNLIFGDDHCQTTDLKVLSRARLSFPSGHSSISSFTATFLILYIENQIICNSWESIPKLLSQVVIGTSAFYVGLSRVKDYFHHPTDVLTGFGIGVLIGIVMYLALKKNFFNKSRTPLPK